MAEFIHPNLSYKLSGILFKVHNELGQFRAENEYGDLIENYLNYSTYNNYRLKWKQQQFN